MRIGIVTCEVLPEPDFDERPLVDALRGRGHEPVMVAWDAPVGLRASHSQSARSAELDGFDLFVMRSAWNYYERPLEFLAWCERAAAHAPMINPPEVFRWNYHKRYLDELAARGVPVVPTRLFERGEAIDVAAAAREMEWDEFVIKPSVSASSFGTKRFHAREMTAAQGFGEDLCRERDVMMQKLMPGFAEPGERALIWIGGEFTHVVRKRPRFAGEDESTEAGGEIEREERAVAEAALGCVRGELSYARVDLIRDVDRGGVMVSELELIEPSLFFPYSGDALEKFVGVIERAVRR